MEDWEMFVQYNNTNRLFYLIPYIPSSSCSECALRVLKVWEMFLKEKPDEVGFIAIIDSKDTTEINKILSTLNYNRTVCFDLKGTYIKENNLYVKARNKTFLLDENNKIIIVGEPPTNKTVWVVYKNAFDKLLK